MATITYLPGTASATTKLHLIITVELHSTSDPSFHESRTAQHTWFTNCYWRQTFFIGCSSHFEQTTLHCSICWLEPFVPDWRLSRHCVIDICYPATDSLFVKLAISIRPRLDLDMIRYDTSGIRAFRSWPKVQLNLANDTKNEKNEASLESRVPEVSFVSWGIRSTVVDVSPTANSQTVQPTHAFRFGLEPFRCLQVGLRPIMPIPNCCMIDVNDVSPLRA